MKRSAIITLVAMLCLPVTAKAEVPGNMTIIVPSSPGAGQDTMGRFLGDALAKHLGNTIVVENRPGAGGAIGTAEVAKAAADGTVLLVSANTYGTNAAVMTNLPFDPEKDLVPVGIVAQSTLLLVAGKRLPIATLEDLVTQGKAEELFYGASGRAALPAFAAELLASTLGIELQPVVYQGAAEALVDVAGGRVDLYIATLTTLLPIIETGNVTPIMVLSEERSATMPDVPTVGELGYPQAEVDVWYGVWAPAGTPPELIAELNAGIVAVTNAPEGVAFLEAGGSQPSSLSPEEMDALVKTEIATWKKIAAEAGIAVE